MILDKSQLAALETPCVVLDVGLARRNIEAMQKLADAAGCRLRPHVKTHKMPLFARMQVEAGAAGITCAKVSEAEVMALGGLEDIFIAYPLVGAFRIRRALELAKKLKRLILAVDSLAGAEALNAAAAEAGTRFEVRLEIDTGAKRTGVPLETAADLALAISNLKNLELTGIYTFKSLNYQGKPTEDAELAAREEGDLMEQAASAIAGRGIILKDISGGSSPTGPALLKTGKVNEIRPGTYIFNDLMLCSEGVASPENVAVRFAATVVSCPRDDYAVIDGGTKCFPTDIALNTAPFQYTGYARIEGKDHLRLDRMNEEHGIIRSVEGKTGLSVGEVITLIPIHVCTAINMQNSVYLLENNVLRREKVEARGMLV
ncbi:alanine racemase [Spirochaetia bacterium]|nr:alanine racemase [Spirochaetia bacterium]